MEDGLSELRMQMSRYADARALGLGELEEFLAEVARRWNSAPFVEGVTEFAQQLGPAQPQKRGSPSTYTAPSGLSIDVLSPLDKCLVPTGLGP